jgi:hypothetical protein
MLRYPAHSRVAAVSGLGGVGDKRRRGFEGTLESDLCVQTVLIPVSGCCSFR